MLPGATSPPFAAHPLPHPATATISKSKATEEGRDAASLPLLFQSSDPLGSQNLLLPPETNLQMTNRVVATSGINLLGCSNQSVSP